VAVGLLDGAGLAEAEWLLGDWLALPALPEDAQPAADAASALAAASPLTMPHKPTPLTVPTPKARGPSLAGPVGIYQ